MKSERQDTAPEPTPEEFAEAAAWVARLHGPNRTSQTERGLRRWLTAGPANATAFEAMNAAWDVTGRLPKQSFSRLSRWERAGYRRGFIRAGVAVAALALIASVALVLVQRARGVVTEIGEQRLVTLEDGTRIFLNTDSRIVVRYDEALRKVELKRGEAQFDVARNPSRPFVVQAGNRQIRALGTSFVVRDDRGGLSVTLIEGKVSVTPVDEQRALDDRSAASAAGARVHEPLGRTVTLAPGQRLTFQGAAAPPKVDEPSIEKVTAWRRGLLDFDAMPLADAVSEMNRYSSTQIIVESADARDVPITGVFRAGDAESFAFAVAKLYHFEVSEDGQGIHVAPARAGIQQPRGEEPN